MQISRFTQVKPIGSIFTPVAVYYQDNIRSQDAWVAIVEGINFPFFGFAFSIEKVLFNYDVNLEDYIDFSKNSILHAQMISNFIVDEARLSANQYSKATAEDSALIGNYDPQITSEVVEDGTTSTEFVYLFK